jgi:Type I phosphodiesterase / nucleotide pyrophosphatase
VRADRPSRRGTSAFALLTAASIVLGPACRPTPTPAPAAARPAPSAPPWLVTIVVDQLAAWIADQRWPLLPERGGFARLRREGLTVRQLRFAHADTDTAPGHSALYTGAVPRDSGIFANEVLGANGKSAGIVADPGTWLVAAADAGQGEAQIQIKDRRGSSLAALRIETVADVLRAAHPDAVIISLSLKDRGALFGGGRRPTLALWLEPDLDAFVTSNALATSLPPWVARLGGPAALRQARAQPWQPLDAAWLAAHAETPDDQPGEGDYAGLGTTFPHVARSTKTWRATPGGDELLLALARAAAEAAAKSASGPVLLALSLSSNDYVGHVFGPESWEAWDELLRLDAGLAGLLDTLDRLVGPERYAVMLAADHGSHPLPERSTSAGAPWCAGPKPDRWQRACGHGRRLSPRELGAAMEQVAANTLGPAPGDGSRPGSWVAGVSEPYVYLSPAARALSPAARARLVREADALLRDRFDVAALVDVRALPDACPDMGDESWQALVCRSVPRDVPADLYVVGQPGTFFDPGITEGRGISHGSPYLYDRAVPLVVRAPGRIRPGTTIEAPVPFSAFARTAASLLGVRPPAAAAPGVDLTARP